MEMPGFEPGALYMRSTRDTTTPHPRIIISLHCLQPHISFQLNWFNLLGLFVFLMLLKFVDVSSQCVVL